MNIYRGRARKTGSSARAGSYAALFFVCIVLSGCSDSESSLVTATPCPPPPLLSMDIGGATTVAAAPSYGSIGELPEPQSPDDAIALFISEGLSSESREFSDTSWGSNVVVMIGEEYYSALGERCRRAVITNNDAAIPTTVVAVRKSGGSWVMAPDIKTLFPGACSVQS